MISSTARHDAHKALLEIFSAATDLPIGLFEQQGDDVVTTFGDNYQEKFEAHCRLIQSFAGGKARCEQDQCHRAINAFRQGQEGLVQCYAGMYNQAIPIVVDDEVRAVLMYGEMQIADPEYQRAALERHEQAVRELELNEEQAAELRQKLLQAKTVTEEELALVKNTLPRVAEWFYHIFDKEDRLQRHVEKITHELQTRLQSVMGDAENLLMEFAYLSREELKSGIHTVLNDAQALATVVHNLGDFQADYFYEPTRLIAVLNEARRIYATEAAERHVEIKLFLEPLSGRSPVLELARDPMQIAFNNLVHNAVKYSFRGSRGRTRFVRIEGWPEGDEYAVMIENYGVGITSEELVNRRIFGDGIQGALTEGEFRTGSGKGLFFAERAVRRHGGRIEVISRNVTDQEPEGNPHLNQFTVYLPISQPAKGRPTEEKA
jgi:signal transduction histidine kinase